ncbi:MAG: hypothetical protein JST43_10775 [Bacteroidetes bacterium]|nr:hypothetical protein [Bacteroidota bacterium]MBS1540134.1 hypothetical protein [Bacteroidota bacterium]
MKKIIFILVFVASASASFAQQQKSTVAPPLYVINGQAQPEWVASKSEPGKMVRPIDNVDPANIINIGVVNGEKAIAKYGDAGKNGVVEITLKKSN